MRGVLVRMSLLVALGASAAVFVAPPAVSTAHAARKKRRKKARNKKRPDPAREIRKEEALDPKKEYDFSDEVIKTKDIKPEEEEEKGPSLTGPEVGPKTPKSLLDEKLDEEIELAQQLLEYETGCEGIAPVRFRLADLYWEKSKRAFFKANDFSIPESQRKQHERAMKKLQGRTLENYQVVIDDCEDYSEYAKVLYYLGRTLTELDRAKDGAAYFKRIIKEFPGSEWVAYAWFMVGEYYFNVANDAGQALKAYQKAMEYPDRPIYGYAIYKQGWCYINTADWDLALERFAQAVHVAEDPQSTLDERSRKALRKEALKDYVRAYANVGEARQAVSTFRKIGGPDALQGMLENLGNWYMSQGAHDNTIIVHRELIKNFPKSTRLAVYQGRIVDAASRSGNRKETVQQAKVLTRYFGKMRTQIERGDVTDSEREGLEKNVRDAEEIAENTIRRLALDYHKEAKKLRGTARDQGYKLALELYKNYLDIFPEPNPKADVNYVFFMRFYYAELLFKLEDFREAANNYEAVVQMNPNPKDPREKEMVLAAAEEAVRSYDELVTDMDRDNPPLVSGTEPKPIPEIKQRLIDACRRYIKYVGSAGEKIVEIRYKMARIYYTYNHFDQAAPAFNDIVENHPANEVACYSANLALDIYNGMKDYRALKEKASAYLHSPTLACGDEDKKKFAKITEQSTFHLIKSELEDKKKYIAAGNAYLKFYRDYPQSDFADDAVYNAAVSYDLGNRLDKANEMRRFLVSKIPDSPLVPETLYNIAQSYERIVDFANAAEYLELFAKRYPKDKRSKDAIYNAGLYRATLGDFAGAYESRTRFISLYPNDPEARKVAYAICEAKEDEARAADEAKDRDATKKWANAHDCYFSYIKKSSRDDTDLLCHAQYRRGEIMRLHTKYAKGAAEQKKWILRNWPDWKRKVGLKKLGRCAEAVGELTFRDLRAAYDAYVNMDIAELNPTERGKKRFDASILVKTKERDRLVAQYRDVAGLGVASWALAALYTIGELYRDSIEKLLGARIPSKIPGYTLTKEDKRLLREKLKEMVAPIEELAVEAYRICVDKANELGVYNAWSTRAFDMLQKLRPDTYPPVIERIAVVKFPQKLGVVSNGLVIADGDGYKPVMRKYAWNGIPRGGEEAGGKEATDKNKEDKDREGKKEKHKEEQTPVVAPQEPAPDGIPQPVKEEK